MNNIESLKPNKTKYHRKIIQIATAGVGNRMNYKSDLFALCNDGSLFIAEATESEDFGDLGNTFTWHKLSPIPQPEESEADDE